VRVLAWTRYDRLGASSRLRFFNFHKILGEKNFQIEFAPLFDDDYLKLKYQGKKVSLLKLGRLYSRRLLSILTIFKYDFIWIEKEVLPGLPAFVEGILKMFNKPYIVDYDDAVFLNYDHKPFKFLRNKITKVMQHSSAIVCGSPFLYDYARMHTNHRNNQLLLLPTTVPYMEKYDEQRQRSKPFRIGWIGTFFTQKYLQELELVFKELAEKKNIELWIMGGREVFSDPSLPVRYFKWSEKAERDFLAQIDIGIMPLGDGDWERGKCGFKLIQYMSHAKPVIGTPIGMNLKIIREGKNGFFANNQEEWKTCILKFTEMSEESWLEFVKCSHQDFAEKYSIQRIGGELTEVFNKLSRISS
jgi:glycosyltransferase involved in cell wall biosynthesis